MAFENYIDIEYLVQLLEKFSAFGPIAGIFLTMIEAFFPILPLSVFVTINVMAFGFLEGYIYSWIGSTIGSICMFFIIKKYGTKKFHNLIKKNTRLINIFLWIKDKGFIPIFILLTFPFTPSIIVCGLAALSGIKNEEYIYAVIFGKLIMILSLSFIGFNIMEFIERPISSLVLIILTLLLSYFAKKIIGLYEKRLNKRHMKRVKKQKQKSEYTE